MKTIIKKIGGAVLGLTLLAGALLAPAPAVGQRVYFHPGRRVYFYGGRRYFVTARPMHRYRWSRRRGRWVRTRRW
jgi:hypothetical protein